MQTDSLSHIPAEAFDDLGRLGGRLAAAGFAGITVTSLLYALAPPLAALPALRLDALAAGRAMLDAFVATKRLFDALFLAGTIAFGLGSILLFAGELRRGSYSWSRRMNVAGFVLGVIAVLASLACMAGVPAQQAVGGTIGLGGVLFTGLSVRIARSA